MENRESKLKINIIVDLDNTLLDSRAFNRKLARIFKKFGKVDFHKTYYEAFIDGMYSFEKHLSFITDERDKKRVEGGVELIFLGIQEFLFSDVVIFLKRFENDNLILLTKGHSSFQMRKVNNLNPRIVSLFRDKSFVQVEKYKFLAVILNELEAGQTFVIDDDREELSSIADKFNDVKTILISRYGELVPNPKAFSIVVENLHEAGMFIQNLFIETLRE